MPAFFRCCRGKLNRCFCIYNFGQKTNKTHKFPVDIFRECEYIGNANDCKFSYRRKTGGGNAHGQVKGYYVAGKTSTAEQGRGDDKTYSASFVALAPASDPQVSIILTIANPKGELGHQGGAICAPVVSNILGEVLEYLEVPKDYTIEDNTVKVDVPDVTNRTVGEAIRMLNNAGLKYSVDVSDVNAIVTAQMPVAGEKLVEKSLVKLYIEGNEVRFNTIVPNVTGLDIVSATKKLSDANLNIKISGSGMSVLQDPPAGSSIEQGSVVRVEFRPVGIDLE